jgi:hypothetical protein
MCTLVPVVLVGCHADPWPPLSADAGPGPDAGAGAGAGMDAAAPDAAVPVIDAPPAAPALVVRDGDGLAVTELTFDTSDDLALQVTNQGAAASAAIALAITGDAQPDVVIDPASTCTGQVLAAAASCTIVLHYLPQTEAARDGTLRITGGPGDATMAIALRPIARPSLVITFAGAALGEVRVERVVDPDTIELKTCTASCRVRGTAGALLRLSAATPSVFGGLTGACTATAPTGGCDVTLGTGTQAVTATFNPAPRELWTRLLGTAKIMSAAYDRAGNLVVAADKITKLSPTGATIWQDTLTVCSVAIGPGDTIYGQTATELIKLDASGATIWTRPLDPHAVGCGLDNDGGYDAYDGFLHNLAVGPDGAVAIHGRTGVARWDSAGTLTWSAPLAFERYTVAIDPDGVVVAAIESINGESTDLARFAPDGTVLPIQEEISGQYHGMYVIDATGRLLATSSGHSHVDALGVSVDLLDADFVPNGICAADTGAAWLYEADDNTTFARVWTVDRFLAGNSLAWTYTSTPVQSPTIFASPRGTSPHDLAGAAEGRIAVVGEFWGTDDQSRGWITTFQP